jgi:hypothetical protein
VIFLFAVFLLSLSLGARPSIPSRKRKADNEDSSTIQKERKRRTTHINKAPPEGAEVNVIDDDEDIYVPYPTPDPPPDHHDVEVRPTSFSESIPPSGTLSSSLSAPPPSVLLPPSSASPPLMPTENGNAVQPSSPGIVRPTSSTESNSPTRTSSTSLPTPPAPPASVLPPSSAPSSASPPLMPIENGNAVQPSLPRIGNISNPTTGTTLTVTTTQPSVPATSGKHKNVYLAPMNHMAHNGPKVMEWYRIWHGKFGMVHNLAHEF